MALPAILDMKWCVLHAAKDLQVCSMENRCHRMSDRPALLGIATSEGFVTLNEYDPHEAGRLFTNITTLLINISEWPCRIPPHQMCGSGRTVPLNGLVEQTRVYEVCGCIGPEATGAYRAKLSWVSRGLVVRSNYCYSSTRLTERLVHHGRLACPRLRAVGRGLELLGHKCTILWWVICSLNAVLWSNVQAGTISS